MQSKKAIFCLAWLRCSLTCGKFTAYFIKPWCCIFRMIMILLHHNINPHIYIICQHELNEKSKPLHRWLKSTAKANITASNFVRNARNYSTMPNLDSSAANLATRSILAKSAPFIATSLVCDKRCGPSCATRALACYGTTPLPPYGTC